MRREKMALTMSQEKMLFYLEKLTAPFIRVTLYTEKCEACLPPALMVTGPCLPGDCLLRTDSRANFHPEICSGGSDGGDKYRVSRIRGINHDYEILLSRITCQLDRISAGHCPDKHQNVSNSTIGSLPKSLWTSSPWLYLRYECQ